MYIDSIDDFRLRAEKPNLVEKISTAWILMFISGAFTQNGVISIPITIIQFLSVIICLWWIRYHITILLQTIFSDITILLICLVSILSIFWTVDVGLTIDRNIWLVLTTIIGYYIATSYNLRELVEIVLWVGFFSAILSLGFTLAIPSSGIMTNEHAGRWRGIYNHKNLLSLVMAITGITFIHFGRYFNFLRWPIAGLISILLWLTGGATGLVTFIVLTGIVPFLRFLRVHMMLLISLLLIFVPFVLLIIVIVAFSYQDILVFLGRDPTLTGRTILWEISIPYFYERPILGYGIRGLFSEGTDIYRYLVWEPEYAHNGWLDILFDFGLVGGLLVLFSMIRTLIRSLIIARKSVSVFGYFPLIYILFIIIMQSSTASVITLVNIFWVLFVSVTIWLASASKKISQSKALLNVNK